MIGVRLTINVIHPKDLLQVTHEHDIGYDLTASLSS